MNNEEIAKLLETELKGCEVTVTSEGNHFYVKAVGECFSGLSKVKRQQEIYRCLQDLISSGEIHAVRMQLFTPQEYSQSVEQN
jgi:acid stress-induced BolA-like protein IbaG/YrbA